MHPKDYLKICNEQHKVIRAAEKVMSEAYDEASKCPLPKNLRPATPADIIEGAILWHPDFDKGHPRWNVVEEVLRPDDDFKAYTYEGSRYGLYGAFVEIEPANIT